MSLRLDRATCESLATTLALAMVRLACASRRRPLALVGEEPCAGGERAPGGAGGGGR